MLENSDIGKRIFLIQNKIKSDNFLLLNGDAIFAIKLDKIFRSHENTKKKPRVTISDDNLSEPKFRKLVAEIDLTDIEKS